MNEFIFTYKENTISNKHRYLIVVENAYTKNSVTFTYDIKKMKFFEKRRLDRLVIKEIKSSPNLQKILLSNSNIESNSLNDLLISTFKAGEKYDKRRR